MTRPGFRPSALIALLDALEADLLEADAGEVRDALRQTGRDQEGACQEVRAALDAAIGQEDGTPVPTWRGWTSGIPLYRH